MHDFDAVRDALTMVTFRNREQRTGSGQRTRMPGELEVEGNHNQCDLRDSKMIQLMRMDATTG